MLFRSVLRGRRGADAGATAGGGAEAAAHPPAPVAIAGSAHGRAAHPPGVSHVGQQAIPLRRRGDGEAGDRAAEHHVHAGAVVVGRNDLHLHLLRAAGVGPL